MVMFDDFEEIFKSVRDFSEYSKALVTFATAVGAILIVIYSIIFIFDLIVGK